MLDRRFEEQCKYQHLSKKTPSRHKLLTAAFFAFTDGR